MRPTTLLVLAASYYQLAVIQRAKELGYRVITTDNVPDNPGHRLADRAYGVDTTDVAGVLRIASAEKIDGIIGPASDVAVPTVARVAEKLGLPGPRPELADVVCDKRAFVSYLADRGLPLPESIPVKPGDRIDPAFFAAGPGILKPDRSSGSKGVFIVSSADEYQQRLPETLRFSPGRKALLMRYVDGYQGTLIGTVEDGEIGLRVFLDRQTRLPPLAATTGLYAPASLDDAPAQEVLEQVGAIWQHLGLDEGPFVCDFVIGDEAYILEVTPRLGGSSVSSLIEEATGFDLIEYGIRLACGESYAAEPRPSLQAAGIVLLGPEEAGPLQYSLERVESLRKEPWVRRLVMDFAPGTVVPAFENGRTRVGECLIVGATRGELARRELDIRQRLRLTVATAPIPPAANARIGVTVQRSSNDQAAKRASPP